MGKKEILFLGCGKMGSILADSLTNHNLTILSKSGKKVSDIKKNYQADLVFIAVKPQDSEKILRKFLAEGNEKNIFHKNTIFVSILAGKKIDFFEKILGKSSKIIRSMPNLPIAEGAGIFAYQANKALTAADLKLSEKIFAEFGTVVKISKEKEFDAFTALFGSGPAYIFLFQEIYAEIATKFGLKKETAQQLVSELFLGSSLMSFNSEKDFKALRETVTSKAGTTDAALQIFQKNSALKKLTSDAINAAIKRSQELSK